MADQMTRDLTIKEAAFELRVSTKSVQRYVRDGRLPAYKLGPHNAPVRIPADGLRKLKGEK